MRALTLSVAAPGSCGELVQGVMDGVSFHVSCPVSVFSVARVGGFGGLSSLREKSRAAVERALEKRGHRAHLSITCESGPPAGIGMASSTADISASVTAALLGAGTIVGDRDVASVAVSVEPTDGTVFSGIVAFDHKRGRYVSRLGPAPDLLITLIDTGGTVDTVAFNRQSVAYSPSQKAALAGAFEMVARGLRGGERDLIGAAATISARVNQEVLPKPRLEEMIDLADEAAGYGVVVAHSGTVMGVLHSPENVWVPESIRARFDAGARTVRLINGGCRVCA